MTHQERSSLSEFMHEEVIAYKASDLPIRQFCEGKPYTFHKLNYWVLKIRKEQNGGQPPQVKGFSAINVSASHTGMPATSHADIIYPSGIRIAIYEPLTASFLKSLL